MKRLIALVTLLCCYHILQAATVAKTIAEKHAQYCQVLGVAPHATLETIKKSYKQLAIKFHPDKNKGNRAALEKFREATEAQAFLLNPENRELTDAEKLAKAAAENAREPFLRAIVLPFLNRCDRVQELAKKIHADDNAQRIEDLKLRVEEQDSVKPLDEEELEQLQKSIEDQRDKLIGDFVQNCQEALRGAPRRHQGEIQNLIDKVRAQACVEPEDDVALKRIRQEIAQADRNSQFMARLDAATNSAWCSYHNSNNVHNLWMRVFNKDITDQDEQELRNLEAAVAQDKIDYDATHAFVAKCRALQQIYEQRYNGWQIARERMDDLINKVQRQMRVTDDDRNVFNREEASLFFQECHNEMTPCGNSTEHYGALQGLQNRVLGKNRLDDVDKQTLAHIKQQKKANFIDQCLYLQRESSANANAADREEAARLRSKLNSDNQQPITAEDQRNFTRLHANVQNAKYWQSFQGKFHVFASFAAPIVLAFLHGYVNNKLARNAGALQQVPFYKAPTREWLTGYFALCWQLGLGINLFQTLSSKYRSRNVSEGKKALATLAYLASIGICQNLGERLPLNGNGWRAPINPNGSRLANIFLSNCSLFMGSAGGVILALSKVGGH